jgi:hypothetical protein
MGVTYIDKAVVEVQPDQRRPHAGLAPHGGRHDTADGEEGVRARRVVERGRQLRRRRRGHCHEHQQANKRGGSHG